MLSVAEKILFFTNSVKFYKNVFTNSGFAGVLRISPPNNFNIINNIFAIAVV